MLFVDAWWALLTSVQTTVLVIMSEQVGKVLAFLGFVVYLLVSRALLHGLQTDRPPAARLLLLRVFGHGRRTERLLDELTQRWRPFGTVDLIAGRDLALRNIDPSEFYTFLSGRMDREFVQGPADLDQRLARRDDRPDPDGRYRVNQFFCHVDTWQLTLNRLVDESEAVLMDLRGFDEHRAGCQYEIARLAEHAGTRPIVLLVDADTNLDLAEAIFAARHNAALRRTARSSSCRSARPIGAPWRPRSPCCSTVDRRSAISERTNLLSVWPYRPSRPVVSRASVLGQPGQHLVDGCPRRSVSSLLRMSNINRRTACTWPGAACAIAVRPAGVTAMKAPRPSSAHSVRSTSPRRSMRVTWWDTRLRPSGAGGRAW